MDIKIRHTTQNDIKDIIEIKRNGWLSAYTHIFGEDAINKNFDNKLNDQNYLNQTAKQIETNPHCYVATIANQTVATMAIKEISENDEYLEILYLYVHPKYQRLGIGKKFYELAVIIANEHNLKSIHVEAIKNNHIGCAFYRKIGGQELNTQTKVCCDLPVEMITFKFENLEIKLSTERLILRRYKETDLEDYFEYISHKDVGPRLGWTPYNSKQDAFERLKIEMHKPFQFAIELKENHKVIGSIELMNCKKDRYSNLNIENNAKEIGFILSPHFWGKGIMPEACKKIIEFAFEDLQCPVIYIGHVKANIQSKKVQDKLGFKIVGELQNYRRWIDGEMTSLIERKMTREDYLNLKK